MVALVDDAVEYGRKVVKDRAEHKFGGPYLFSWILCNHAILMVVFSGEKYSDRLASVRELFDGSLHGYWQVFGVPFVFAVGYVFFAPISELIVKSGVALADKIWRSVNGRLFKIGWYSESEVEKIKVDCAKEVGEARVEVRDSHGRENSAKALMVDNKERFDQMQEKYLRIFRSSLANEPVFRVDVQRLDSLLAQFPGKEKLIQGVVFDGIPQPVVMDLVQRLIGENSSPLTLYMHTGAMPYADMVLSYSIDVPLIKKFTNNDYSVTVRLTDLGAALIDEVVQANPQLVFADQWRTYIERQRMFVQAA